MSQINNSFIISIFIILGLIIILFVLILPVIRKIDKFQEVIFQVVSRITYDEVDSQINKFQSYQNKILNDDKSWISYNFLNAHKQKLDELRLSYDKTNSFASTQKEKKRKNQINNQKLISSQLVQTHLKTFLYFSLFFLFCLSYVAFISIALGVSYKYQKEIQQRFELYQYNVQNLQKFQTMLSLSESALRIDLIQSIDDQFPIQNQIDVKNNFLSSIQDLNQFLIQINDYIQNTIQIRASVL
ncbi:transmembrane protein, putative (macronuclear) [Tetrahymena thermophila SB210]|uniref:Transmembrane protein, putative n=1 Tax=Tetrahymena thermophila (strain SB210) TaxID=312017 RepID=W7XGQ9_TETTS|nr:transmembrane protein, putative [Tetrahymena thermophila SB210]EWS72149.1 transmembrane protein, putative [Tetrahymena thermophila SB210]|eukprot:XP_012655311.1 transmembrane protein, putative [Tetrahymena thermophila SB210]